MMKQIFSRNVRNLLLISLSAFSLAFFLYLSTEVREASLGLPELIGKLDLLAIRVAGSIRSPFLTRAIVPFTDLGSGKFLSVFVVLLGAVFALRKQIRSAFLLVVSGITAAALSALLKSHFERARPDSLPHLVNVDGFSYPSGHSLGATAIYLTATILLIQHTQSKFARFTILCLGLFLSLGIGFSRIYLGVHYFSDVLAGLCIGVSVASLLGAISRRSDEKEGKIDVE